MMLPNEIISPVRNIPRGDCPEMKAVGEPDSTFVTTDQNDTGWESGTNSTTSVNDTWWESDTINSTTFENGLHNKIDDAGCPCTGAFFIICWFFRCLLSWLF
jgi:hypothetical protein